MAFFWARLSRRLIDAGAYLWGTRCVMYLRWIRKYVRTKYNMKLGRQVLAIILLLAVGVLYEKHKKAEQETDPDSDYALVRKYLLGGQDEGKPGRPLVWIHADDSINARWWPSFGSRNTRDLNQPYEAITVSSIIKTCRDDFMVCVVRDRDFADLVPGWTIDLNRVAEPMRSNMRRLALAQLLQEHGGVLVPSTFLAFRSLKPIYDAACDCSGGMAVAELPAPMGRGPTADGPVKRPLYPRPRFMACKAGSHVMGEYAQLLGRINETDFTADSAFEGEEAAWCRRMADYGRIATVPPELTGGEDAHGKPVGIERLMGTAYIPLCSRALGLLIPADELRRRVAYGWFVRQSAHQAMLGDTALSKYLLVAATAP